MKKTGKTITVDLQAENHKAISEIVKRTGESRVELINRVINSEYKRIINGETVSEATNRKLDEMSNAVSEILELSKNTSESGKLLREGINKVYCAILFSLKELFRTMHYIARCFSHNALLTNDKLTIINSDSDKEAANSFNSVLRILNESKPVEIIDFLKK